LIINIKKLALYAFGTDLTKQASIESDNVPFIVKKCCEEVEKRGIKIIKIKILYL